MRRGEKSVKDPGTEGVAGKAWIYFLKKEKSASYQGTGWVAV